ncbi:glycine C-acetyltransferase [Symbiobacterium thermophilum]|uniref:8-amino-7-oxononanoate synthase n=2 Tax=Symbiobacterium thermophilum TaxID=2734 RepID=BIOF_SYMTH|nr:glycine C-acetyltransferase [Symbiobacterium thermophilum]Q67N86.1 RecName: Full=8-amino-7-oxononanoate synthase; Short=AONS; AltName: Full=7-keto-8-amino-pelargonic acid synthase; Short=7-KAP synthase; Short=KAPA synthase; AltName: Full=8-amino-7-ketopelargonate synthase; AltName: Full=Alpha-oxoamine synthase [Symbiobacterium thermophilum IAM 14863]MBY6276576.1 8-amino-7-oxononanoate synthase [Symbiobacterium thermophilum]BAD40857.1 8-amino-7-oxononanoate synthetase [Symbiobacterium thermoph
MALTDFLVEELNGLKQAGLYRPLKELQSPQRPRSIIDGREVINLSSNNYLGLADDPRLKQAMIEATEAYGAGSGAVRTIIGTMTIHNQLEQKLAEFKHVEAAVVFQSGFTCNSGVIPVLVGEGDAVISDELNHASIIDGCRLSKAKIHRYKHADMDDLARVLKETDGQYRRRLIITDGVFSMDGDIAPLPDIVELAEKHGCMTYVDDAHSSGVLGKNGRGSVNHFGLDGRVTVQVGTLSKAVGVLGGYVAGPRALIELLWHKGRPFLFSTSHPPGVAAACLKAIEIMEQEPERIDRLWENTRYFKERLTELGFDTGKSETPITPVIVGDEVKAMQLSDRLLEEGVFAQGIAFPTVPRGKARVRTIVTAAHTKEDLDEALAAFAKVGRELGLI